MLHRLKILWKKTMSVTIFAGVLEQKICSLRVSTFLGRMELGKILFFSFSEKEPGNARNTEVIIGSKCSCYLLWWQIQFVLYKIVCWKAWKSGTLIIVAQESISGSLIKKKENKHFPRVSKIIKVLNSNLFVY